jgi:hypothetical protein
MLHNWVGQIQKVKGQRPKGLNKNCVLKTLSMSRKETNCHRTETETENRKLTFLASTFLSIGRVVIVVGVPPHDVARLLYQVEHVPRQSHPSPRGSDVRLGPGVVLRVRIASEHRSGFRSCRSVARSTESAFRSVDFKKINSKILQHAETYYSGVGIL